MADFQTDVELVRQAVITDLREIEEIGKAAGLQLLGLFIRRCEQFGVPPAVLLRHWQEHADAEYDRAAGAPP